MNINQWLIFLGLIQVLHFLGTWKLYIKAGRKPLEALIPIYSAIVLMRIINRPVWWVALLFIPVINLILLPVIWVETLKSFGRDKTTELVWVVITLGFYLFYINYTQDVTYLPERDTKPKNAKEDFVGSIIFAVIVATTVHTYVMQPYTIPTSSLEKSLLVGDFLFVSKFHYGARTPMTPVALPMVHDMIPATTKKSYIDFPQLPSFRFPAMETIKNNDIVVFNWPTDTVKFFGDTKTTGLRKPIDKKTNYVKRCLGIPGDSLKIENGIVMVNGKALPIHDRQKIQFSYFVETNGSLLNKDYLVNTLKITDHIEQVNNNMYYFAALTDEHVATLKNNPNIISINKREQPEIDPTVFPQNKQWNVDNFGPIFIPKAGATVAITKETLPLYKLIIEEYEGNDLKVNGDEIRINGIVANTYTFNQDYYWMMGDNRHNSSDSRMFGFVPHDHIVGKPVFIWLSLDQNVGWGNFFKKIRWERMFTTVGGDGEPVSYFKYFLILLALWFGFNHFRKKKLANKA